MLRLAAPMVGGARDDDCPVEYTLRVAVLVHPPEHYDRSGRQLVGSQAMRARHLAAMGFRVMSVNMNHANQLAMHPDKLKQYLQSLYKTATAVKK